MPSSEALVQFRDIAKTYDGEVNVLEGLNLDICKGEFLTLLGASGSGKTTVLMMLAGFEVPTAGDILLDGQRLNDVPPHKRNMGVVFQSYALFPHMTVAENVGYPLKHRRVPKAERAERVSHALKMVDLVDFSARLPNQLSGGQQQRVALARTLVFEPEIILMDEPLGALDKNLREHMQLEIKRLHDQLGMTVVYVTHDQSEALTMSDRIAVFRKGEILQIGSPNSIYERPTSSYVANFVGENNNLFGTVTSSGVNESVVELRNGQTIRAVNPMNFGEGAQVNVVVRPEHMQLSLPAADHENSVSARVRDIIYYGDHQRVELQADGLDDITAKTGFDRRGTPLQVGATLDVFWPMEQGLALDQASDAEAEQ